MLPSDIINDPLVIRARELLDSLELEQRNHALQEAINLAERKPYLHTVQDSKLVRLSYEQAISAATVDAEALGSLYLHIPFCTKRCTYCHYYKVTDAEAGLMDEFADVLMAEFDLIHERLGIDQLRPRTIHFGGGTPSLLSEDQWLRLLTLLGERIDLAAVEEVAIECSPEDVTPEKLRTWRDSGVNRLSLGVQSFSEPILRHLERVHSPEQSVACIELAQAAGFENINVDLMHAMPASSFPLWLHDIRTAQRLAPESVTIYAT
ncbi:MAG: radical SAM protein, partial [Myxococcales bacterium]|nr:radical SAM protein [Myxococcales bacterium]